MKLTPKQEKFCQEYVKTGNKSEAYRRAYSTKNMKPETVNRRAFELHEDGKIKARLQFLQKQVAERNKIDIDEIVTILSKLARFDIADLYDDNGNLKNIHDIQVDARLSLEGVDTEVYSKIGEEGIATTTTKKVKVCNRKQALDMLMKHLGGYEKDNSQKNKPAFVVFDGRKKPDHTEEEE